MDLSETPAVVLRRHPWELARLDFFRLLIRRKGLHLRPIKILDVGSGDAWFALNLLPILAEGSHIFCCDPAYSDNQLRSLVSNPHITLTTTQPEGTFDLILLLDVLEHIENDRDFLLKIVNEILPPDGIVVISVPAWRMLFGPHDVRLHHFRRYQPSAVTRLILRSGLEIESNGGLFHSLLLPRLFQLVSSRVVPLKEPPANAGDWKGGRHFSELVNIILKIDIRLSLLLARVGVSLPGLSCWALCRKP